MLLSNRIQSHQVVQLANLEHAFGEVLWVLEGGILFGK